jgi:hypothetical protein
LPQAIFLKSASSASSAFPKKSASSASSAFPKKIRVIRVPKKIRVIRVIRVPKKNPRHPRHPRSQKNPRHPRHPRSQKKSVFQLRVQIINPCRYVSDRGDCFHVATLFHSRASFHLLYQDIIVFQVFQFVVFLNIDKTKVAPFAGDTQAH